MRTMADRRSALLQRLTQLRQAFTSTRAADPKFVPLMLGVALVALVVPVVVGVLLDRPVFGVIAGVLLAVLGALIVFGQRTSAAAISTLEGKPGAAAAVLQSMRGPWRVTLGVAATRKQDFVHRVVGRPGVVVVGEGSPARVASLLKQEKRRVARAVGDTPVHEVSVGNGDSQVPLRQLQAHMTRLPRAVKRQSIAALDTRLSALGGTTMPVPKGPMPRGRRRA